MLNPWISVALAFTLLTALGDIELLVWSLGAGFDELTNRSPEELLFSADLNFFYSPFGTGTHRACPVRDDSGASARVICAVAWKQTAEAISAANNVAVVFALLTIMIGVDRVYKYACCLITLIVE